MHMSNLYFFCDARLPFSSFLFNQEIFIQTILFEWSQESLTCDVGVMDVYLGAYMHLNI